MGRRGSVRVARSEDMKYLASRLRKQDVDELYACYGLTPSECLVESFLISNHTFTILSDEEAPIGVFGVASNEKDIGVAWMVATDELKLFRGHFIEQVPTWIAYLDQYYTLLYNVVDKRNTVSIRWLKAVGFTFIREIPHYGFLQLPFYEFARLR